MSTLSGFAAMIEPPGCGVGKGAHAPCPPIVLAWRDRWARCALPTLQLYDCQKPAPTNTDDRCGAEFTPQSWRGAAGRRVGKGAYAPCPPMIFAWRERWARCALPTLQLDGYTAAAATTCASNCSRLVWERQPFMVAAKRSRMPSSNAVTIVSCT